MNNTAKELLSRALKEAMNQEDLNTRAAAKCLNLNPCYVSMAQNPKSWDAMSKSSWERIQEWAGTREKLFSFVIPEGEQIWQPKEKPAEPRKKAEKKQEKQEEKQTIMAPKPIEMNMPFETEQKIKEVDKQMDQILEKRNDPAATFDPNLFHKFNKLGLPETARLKVALDIEINLVINGHKISLR